MIWIKFNIKKSELVFTGTNSRCFVVIIEYYNYNKEKTLYNQELKGQRDFYLNTARSSIDFIFKNQNLARLKRKGLAPFGLGLVKNLPGPPILP